MPITAAAADATRKYGELLVTTAEHIHPGIVENSIDNHPVASIFFGKIGAAMNSAIGNDGAMNSGAEAVSGESIRVNVKLGKNESFGWLGGGYDQISMDTSDTARGSRANFKLGAGSVVISGSEMRKNSGSAQVSSLLLHKQTDTVSSAVDSVAEAMLTSSSQPNAVTSLDTLISADDSVQGLSGSNYAKWNSRGLSTKGTASGSISFAGDSFASQGISDWRTAWMNSEEGSIKPKVILTTDLIAQYYEGSLTPNVRFEDVRMGDIGFQAIRFKTAPVFHDPYCATGVTYFLNTDFLKLKYLSGALFDLSTMERGTNQDAFVAHVLFEANLCISARKYNNKITGQTA